MFQKKENLQVEGELLLGKVGGIVLCHCIRFFFLWASCSNRCLAALDLGADVEQQFDYLIIQNRHSVQSMGK